TASSSGRITSKWEEIPASELYTVIIQGWNLTKQNYLELGVLALKRGNLTKEARTCFDKATEEPTIEPVVNKYRQQAKYEKKTRDNDSRKIYTQANNAFNSNNYQTALEGFYLLKYRYSDTKAYKENDADIRTKISQCEKAIK
ncbi:hypothetical protein HY772_09275, partial [Candidatus Woesearchaeota archaeon]|nr:hypothetical protein [Candidatus Woesearchaeota archaeon]